MIEKQVPPAVQVIERNGNEAEKRFRKDPKQSLTAETKNKDLTPWQLDAVKIIDGMMLDIDAKKDFLIHFLAESGDWTTIKKFREIREYFVSVSETIIYDDTKVSLYESFHSEWTKNRAKEALLKGENYHEIHERFDIDRDHLRAMRRRLYEEGRIDLELTEQEIKVYKRRKKGIKNNLISDRIRIPHNEVNRIAGKLLLMGLIDALDGRGRIQAEETRYLYDEIVDYHRMGLSTMEISRELNQSYFKIRHAKYRLRQAGEITDPPVNKVAEQRRKEAQERRAKIKAALEDPNAMVEQLPDNIKGLTVAQAKRHTRKLISSGELLPRRINRRIYLEKELQKDLDEYQETNQGKDFPFWKFVQKHHTDFYTALKIYEKIEKQAIETGQKIPPIRRRTWAKKRKSS
jgi:hypothetical protein